MYEFLALQKTFLCLTPPYRLLLFFPYNCASHLSAAKDGSICPVMMLCKFLRWDGSLCPVIMLCKFVRWLTLFKISYNILQPCNIGNVQQKSLGLFTKINMKTMMDVSCFKCNGHHSKNTALVSCFITVKSIFFFIVILIFFL